MKVIFAGVELAEGVGAIGTIAADLMPSGENNIQQAPYFRGREQDLFNRGGMIHALSVRFSPPPAAVPGAALQQLVRYFDGLPKIGSLIIEQSGGITEYSKAGLQRYAPARTSIGVSNQVVLTWLVVGVRILVEAVGDTAPVLYWLFGNGASIQWGDGSLIEHG